MAAADPWSTADNLLCVRLDNLGDVLMTTPALRALKDSHPSRRLTLLASPAGAEVASLVPEIDATIIYDAPWMKDTAIRADSRPEYAIAYSLRRLRFDGAIIFTVYSQNPLPAAFLCYLADIPLRLAHCHENPYQLLTHWVPDPEPARTIRHEVRRQLDLVAHVGAQAKDERMSLRIPAAARRRIRRIMRELGLHRVTPWTVMHPGATAPSRRYPAEGFAEAARHLVQQMGCQVVFTGTDAERPLVQRIQMAMAAPSHSLAGALSLAELAALLLAAPILIANNTGPVHLAAALGTPVVDLYALTNPQHTPWHVPHRVLFHDVPCKYCYKSVCPQGHHDCLRLVPPEAIALAVAELLGETRAHRSLPKAWS